MIITILFVIPGIVLSFVFNAFGSKVNIYLGNYGEYFIIIVYNILVCALFAFLSRGIFEKKLKWNKKNIKKTATPPLVAVFNIIN